MKNIIVGGCSFTDKNMPKNARPKPLDFKMWPEYIAEWSKCKVINTAVQGYGNQAIYHNTLKEILNNLGNIKHVYIMWSEWARQEFLLGYKPKDNNDWPVTVIPRLENDEYNKTQAFYQSAKQSDIFGKVDFSDDNQMKKADTNNTPF